MRVTSLSNKASWRTTAHRNQHNGVTNFDLKTWAERTFGHEGQKGSETRKRDRNWNLDMVFKLTSNTASHPDILDKVVLVWCRVLNTLSLVTTLYHIVLHCITLYHISCITFYYKPQSVAVLKSRISHFFPYKKEISHNCIITWLSHYFVSHKALMLLSWYHTTSVHIERNQL